MGHSSCMNTAHLGDRQSGRHGCVAGLEEKIRDDDAGPDGKSCLSVVRRFPWKAKGKT